MATPLSKAIQAIASDPNASDADICAALAEFGFKQLKGLLHVAGRVDAQCLQQIHSLMNPADQVACIARKRYGKQHGWATHLPRVVIGGDSRVNKIAQSRYDAMTHEQIRARVAWLLDG